MGTAVTIIIFFAISSTIVRVASVILEHTGIPIHVARLQSLSALTGTGFTTSESEVLLSHPARRKVMTYLMMAGGIGIASVTTTLIISSLSISDTPSGLLRQIVAILLAFVFVRYMLLSKRADRLICNMARRYLLQQAESASNFAVLFTMDNDWVIAEHQLGQQAPNDPARWELDQTRLIATRDTSGSQPRAYRDGDSVNHKNLLIMLGPMQEQLAFAEAYGESEQQF